MKSPMHASDSFYGLMASIVQHVRETTYYTFKKNSLRLILFLIN